MTTLNVDINVIPPNPACCSGDHLCHECTRMLLNQQPVPRRSEYTPMPRYSLTDFDDSGRFVRNVTPQADTPTETATANYKPMPRFSLTDFDDHGRPLR